MKILPLFRRLSGFALAAGLATTAVAQPAGQTNYQWSAAGDKATWNQGANWTQGIAPLTDGTSYAIDTFANAGGSTIPINVGVSDVVNINDSMFGPLWGQTLNIYGSVSCGWGQFVWGDMNAGVTTVNVQTNSNWSLRDTLALGTAWWFAGGPNVVVNVYSNAFVGVAWLQHGARLNIYPGGTVSVTNALNTGAATVPVFAGGLDNDTTRSINLQFGAKLILPATYTSTVTNWIARGILWAYGSPVGESQIVINEADPNWPGRTVVTTTATGPNVMTAVRIQIPRAAVTVGGLQQALVFADYTTSTNVNVTSTATNLTYLSTAPSVVTVAANGQIRAVGPGTATVRAIIGSLSNSVSLTVSTWTNSTSMVHRYSFSETSGSTAADSVGGASGDATIYNSALFNAGQLELNGVDGYASFPAGLLTNLNAVTIETWVTLGTVGNWAVMFTFGDSDGSSGHHYISFQPHTGFTTTQAGIRDGSTEQNPVFTPVLDNYANLHLVCVYHPEAGYLSVYTNGVQAAINPNITVTLTDAFATGSPFNYLGRSQWVNDPPLAMQMNEFRIYNGPLSTGQIKANSLLGPNQLIGANNSVSLTATASGNNIILTWPTTSALVTLLSSPTLGATANWTEVSAGSLVIDGSNYKWTVPRTGTAQYFRLKK
ncbi:MAG: hypothetical protein QM813_25605 [Verrucomicrobiota bacterium]